LPFKQKTKEQAVPFKPKILAARRDISLWLQLTQVPRSPSPGFACIQESLIEQNLSRFNRLSQAYIKCISNGGGEGGTDG